MIPKAALTFVSELRYDCLVKPGTPKLTIIPTIVYLQQLNKVHSTESVVLRRQTFLI